MGACDTFCFLAGLVAMPVLVFIGYLCSTGSEMIEIPAAVKPTTAKNCYIAAGLYALTFVYFAWKKNRALPAPAGYQMHVGAQE